MCVSVCSYVVLFLVYSNDVTNGKKKQQISPWDNEGYLSKWRESLGVGRGKILF